MQETYRSRDRRRRIFGEYRINRLWILDCVALIRERAMQDLKIIKGLKSLQFIILLAIKKTTMRRAEPGALPKMYLGGIRLLTCSPYRQSACGFVRLRYVSRMPQAHRK